MAYVAGFDGNEHAMRMFESYWIQAKLRCMRNRKISHSVEGIVNLAQDVMAEFTQDPQLPNHDLRLMHCGTLQRIKDAHS